MTGSGAGSTGHHAAQPCLAVPLGGGQFCSSPKLSPLRIAYMPTSLGWCPASSLYVVTSPQGHPSAPSQGGCPQALLSPRIPRSWGLGAALSDGLTQAHRNGEQLFWLWTKATQEK